MSLHETVITGILLAAGTGTRFSADGSRDKLLARLPDGVEVAVASLRLLKAACGRVLVVVRPGAQQLSRRLEEEGGVVLECATAAQGMGASLACAARACMTSPGPCIVALADMPWIRPETFRQVAAMLAFHEVVAPLYAGRRGHPVGFAATLLPALTNLSGDVGARHFLEGGRVYAIECDDAGVVQDIDRPGDLPGDLH